MRKKGFTLIELLAVIVILGIITVIAVPKILDVINKSRESASNSSIKLVKDAIKTQVASSDLTGPVFTKETDGCYIFNFDDQTSGNAKALEIKNKDKVSGSIKYCNNTFSDDTLKFDGFVIKEDNSKNNYITTNLQLNLEAENATDSVWKDSSNNKIDGTINGPIRQDKGYYFDGSNDYISFKQMNYDNVTVESTFTPQISSNNKFIGIIENIEKGGYGIFLYDDYIYGQIYVGGSPQSIGSIEKYQIGETYTVQLTYDGKEMKLYINNKLQNTINVTGTINTPSNATILMLGVDPRGTYPDGPYFKGTIYSARIYDRALTIDELYNNYNIEYKKYLK